MTQDLARAWIEKSLSEADLEWAWAESGEPVASLGVQLPNRRPLSLTVRHTGSVLQVIAHDALRDPLSPQLLADRDVLSREWAFGRMYFVEASQAWDMSVGLYAPESAVRPEPLLAAISSLGDAPDLVLAGRSPELSVTPPPNPAEVLLRVGQALAASSTPPQKLRGGEILAIALQLDRAAVEVHWFVWGSLIVARAIPLRAAPILAEPRVLSALNYLNSRLDIGGVGLDYQNQTVCSWVAHPVAWFDVTPEAVQWTSERAGSWVEAALEQAIGAV